MVSVQFETDFILLSAGDRNSKKHKLVLDGIWLQFLNLIEIVFPKIEQKHHSDNVWIECLTMFRHKNGEY